VGGLEWACYAREDEDMPDALKENEAETMPADDEYPETEPESGGESDDAEPDSDDEGGMSDREMLHAMFKMMTTLGPIIEKLAGADAAPPAPEIPEAPPMPEPPPDDEGMMAAEQEADQFQLDQNETDSVHYDAASKEAVARIEDAQIGADPKKFRARYRTLYAKYGRGAADHFTEGVIENGRKIPGARPDESDAVEDPGLRIDVNNLTQYAKEEQEAITTAASRGMSEEQIGRGVASWQQYRAGGGTETLATYLKHAKPYYSHE